MVVVIYWSYVERKYFLTCRHTKDVGNKAATENLIVTIENDEPIIDKLESEHVV